MFNWHAVPEHENKRRGHSWAPAHSPTMAGGLFSIDKLFFEKLGAYDPGFDIWGEAEAWLAVEPCIVFVFQEPRTWRYLSRPGCVAELWR